MKIEIDTQNKTILVREFINIDALLKELKAMNINLKDYSLKCDVQTNYYNYPYYQYYRNDIFTIPNNWPITGTDITITSS